MRINTPTFWIGRLLAPLCLFLPALLPAQIAPEGSTRTMAAAKNAVPNDQADLSATKAHDDTFVIGNDDVLAISVWKEPEISRAVPVRSDGKISLPLVGEVMASGETPLK